MEGVAEVWWWGVVAYRGMWWGVSRSKVSRGVGKM